MSRRVIQYDDVVEAGLRQFVTTATIDMDQLAEDLAVSRATLYRVIEGRDALLGDVLWATSTRFIRLAVDAASGHGVERAIAVQRQFWHALEGSKNLRTFVEREFDTAARVLFTPAGRVQERFVASVRRLLEEAVEADELSPSLDLDDMAYVMVRVFQSLWFSDVLIGRPSDPEVAERVARALLYAE